MASADIDAGIVSREAVMAGLTLSEDAVLFGADARRWVARSLEMPSSFVRLFDPESLQEVLRDDEVTSDFQVVVLHSSCVASASVRKIVTVWNADTGDWQLMLMLGDDFKAGNVSWSPNCKRLATSSVDTVQIWNVVTGDCELTLLGHACIISSLTFSLDGKLVASASGDGTVRIWNAETGVCEKTLSVPPVVVCMSFSPDGRRLATVSYEVSVVVVSNTESGIPASVVMVLNMDVGIPECSFCFSDSLITHVCFSPTGEYFAITYPDFAASIWRLERPVCEFVLLGHNQRVCDLSFSPDGRRFATASSDFTAKIWSVDTVACELTLAGHQCRLTSVRFSADGMRLVTACLDSQIRIWNAMTGDCELCLTGDIGRDSVAVFIDF